MTRATRTAPSIEVEDSPLLQASRRFCAELTRRHARNFYFGLKMQPEPKRSAMFALYAYLRLVDDIADAEDGRTVAQRQADLDAFQQRTRDALAGRLDERAAASGNDLMWPMFVQMARTYDVPPSLFDDAIAGQRQDLEFAGFDTFEQLADYCYRVAGVVGLASIHIWGFEGGAQTQAMAVDRGLAFQLTNILRDLREDADRNRVYLPRQELFDAGLSEMDLKRRDGSPAFVAFMHRQVERARECYRRSAELERRIEADSRTTLATMTAIYRALLEKVAKNPKLVLRRRVSLSLLTKLRLGWKATRTARTAKQA